MKLISILLISSQLTFSLNAFCDDSYMTPLDKGKPAPYPGVLLSPPAIASIIADKESVPEQIKIEVEKVRQEEQTLANYKLAESIVKSDTDKKILQTQLDNTLKSKNEIQEELIKERNKPSGWTYVGIGAGLTVLTLIGGFFGLRAIGIVK